MKTLYIDCSMGAAGDMLTAALLELFEKDEREKTVEELNSIGIPNTKYILESSEKCGITGSHMKVTVNGTEEDENMHGHSHEGFEHSHEGHDHHGHSHSSMQGISHLINDHLNLPSKVKNYAMAVYSLIAQAESSVHAQPINEIHFHEVGTMDAIADICAVCFLMNKLNVDQVIASPVHVGSGSVKCAHGILPVPAPATAYILKDVPIYQSGIKGELCTPTGAALLKVFADDFGDMPAMKTKAIGYGMGKKDFERANCVRVMLGEVSDEKEQIAELSFNVDDMSAEAIGFAMDELFAGGALEVFTVPAGMKKNRPGTLVNVICKIKDREKMVQLIFKHTSTIGIREKISDRYTLDRNIEIVETEVGSIRKKVSTGYGVVREKYEYDDVARAARENDLSIGQVMEMIRSGKKL